MKKVLPFMAIGILVFSGLGAVAVSESENEIIETISFSIPVIQEKEEFVSINVPESTKYTFGYGEPCLPYITKVYTFPFGTSITNVEVTLSSPETQTLSKLVEPAPAYRIESTIYEDDYMEPDIDALYKNIDVYPEEQFGYRTGAGLDGEERAIFLTVTVYPTQYIPESNTLNCFESAKIDISYEVPESPITFPDDYDLLIIAPEEFSSALQPLINHKNGLDPPIRTTLTTLEDIPDYPEGVDEQEDIKYYVKEAIETMGITYLILVGSGAIETDPPSEEIFPVRYAWIPSQPHEDNYPSDLYYADIYNSTMGFSNWDRDGDGKYAEFTTDLKNVDAIPDVYLGKFLCKNVEEVNIMVDKAIHYKSHNKMTKKILQMGGDSFTDDNVNEGEYANTKVLEKLPGYSSTKLWASTETLTKPNIRSGFHSSVDFTDFCGHGSFMSVATHPPKDGDTWIPPKTPLSDYTGFTFFDFDIYLFRNYNKLPIAVYKSCSPNKYTKSEQCFGWKNVILEDGGAIAEYGATGISYGATGQAIINVCTGWMEQRSFQELVSTKILGQVWGNCVRDYYLTFESNLDLADWKTICEWSLLGDPTLAAEDGLDPYVRSVNPMPTLFERIIGRFPQLEKLLLPVLVKLMGNR